MITIVIQVMATIAAMTACLGMAICIGEDPWRKADNWQIAAFSLLVFVLLFVAIWRLS